MNLEAQPIDQRPDKKQVAVQFSRAARDYDQVASLQANMGERLILSLDAQAPPGPIVDLGCGTGELLSRLTDRQRPLWGLDLAPGMLDVARLKIPTARWIFGDIESVPLPDQSAAIVISNAAVQWCDRRQALAEVSRLLLPKGQWLVSTFGPQSLAEWRQAWAEIGIRRPPLHGLASLGEWEAAARALGLTLDSTDRELVVQPFDEVDGFLRACKQLGASFAGPHQTRWLGRQKYRRLREYLQQRLQEDELQLTWECLYLRGHAAADDTR